MSRWMVVTAMLALAGVCVWRAAVAARQVTAEREDAADCRGALISGAAITVLILLANAMAFISQIEVQWWTWQDHMAEAPSRWTLVWDQAALLFGSAGLMWLTVAAIRNPRAIECDPRLMAPNVMLIMVEKLLPRFWLAALGVIAIFGVFARGVALLLAVELTLSWIIGRVGLAVQRRKIR